MARQRWKAVGVIFIFGVGDAKLGNGPCVKDWYIVVKLVLWLPRQKDVAFNVFGDFLHTDGFLCHVESLLQGLVHGQATVQILDKAARSLVTEDFGVVTAHNVWNTSIQKRLTNTTRVERVNNHQLDWDLGSCHNLLECIRLEAINVTSSIFECQLIRMSMTREMKNSSSSLFKEHSEIVQGGGLCFNLNLGIDLASVLGDVPQNVNLMSKLMKRNGMMKT
mmetsp:Transcript_9746/g.22927  ORF Transcript_9746/g.22927 Transcript_9746/m.22927 type:complete len:221 (+) Transcript_9746:2020-2682(+)